MKRLSQIIRKNLKTHDFKQGHIGNCGLIAALASLPKRPEFLKEIAPKTIKDRDGKKLEFKMFSQGKPLKVTIDYNLPLDNNNSLIYARSARNEKFYLASYFEKAFVKQACFNSYKKSEFTDTLFALMSFSDCMGVRGIWDKNGSKDSAVEFLKSEVNNKSSIVLALAPSLNCEPEDEANSAHAYTIIDYNCRYQAVKLYNPSCYPQQCVSDENLPQSLTMSADPAKGELWLSVDQFKKRHVSIASLLPKDTYKSVLKLNEQVNFRFVNKVKRKVVWKACVKEPSTILINLFSYSHMLHECDLKVATIGADSQTVDLDYKLKKCVINHPTLKDKNGCANSSYFQQFELQPNSYEFSFEINIEEDEILGKIDDFFLKVGCTSKCTLLK